MERLRQMGAGGLGAAAGDTPMVDTAEQIYISSLALLKMLKHGAGQPGTGLIWRPLSAHL